MRLILWNSGAPCNQRCAVAPELLKNGVWVCSLKHIYRETRVAEEPTSANALWVHQERAVITAQNHDIWAFAPEFLVSSGIIPDSWECRRVLRTPPAVDIEIGPTRWNMTETALWIEQTQNHPLAERLIGPRLIPELTRKFLEATPYLPSYRLHFSWDISVRHADPGTWLAKSVFNEAWASELDIVTLIPTVDIIREGVILQVRVSSITVGHGNNPSAPSLMFSCMATRGIDQSVRQMVAETNNWEEWLGIAARTITLMLNAGRR